MLWKGQCINAGIIYIKQSDGKKKPHFASEERILRQYERGVLVTNCHVLYPLGKGHGKGMNFFFDEIQIIWRIDTIYRSEIPDSESLDYYLCFVTT